MLKLYQLLESLREPQELFVRKRKIASGMRSLELVLVRKKKSEAPSCERSDAYT
jgi:hypothetical protein